MHVARHQQVQVRSLTLTLTLTITLTLTQARVPGRVGGGVVRVRTLDERGRVDAGEGAFLVLRAGLGEELVRVGGDDREVDEEAAAPRGLG